MTIERQLSSAAFAVLIAATAGTASAGGKLTRIATVPLGAEVAGIAVNGQGELFFNAQHPGGEPAYKAGGPAALIGYIASVDIRKYSGDHVAIPGDDAKGKVHVAAGDYVVLGRSGDKLGDGKVLGGVYDAKGELMFISNDVDFNAFIPLGASEAYLYTAFEGAGRFGVASISRLKLVRANGRWQADLAASKMLDLGSIEGAWILCYGEISPWGTPIFSEEYYFFNTSLWNHPDMHDDDDKPTFKKGNDMMYHMPKMMNRHLGRISNPYRYGYNIEMNNPKGEPKLVRHYAMGRFSHENVTIMADGRTAYQSDDDSAKYTNAKWNTNSGGVFFKFVADKKADLSAGTLYAAKLTQDGSSDPTKAGFKLDWIKLAHGSDAQVGKWIDEYNGIGPDKYKPGETNFISDMDVINWAEGKLGKDLNLDGKVGSYKDDRPAFLESRKAAAALGATYEWNKLEGVSSANGKLYISVSEISETMDKGWGHVNWATGERDKRAKGDIALDKEACGAVYVGNVGSDGNVTRIEPLLVGKTTDGKKRCDDLGIAHPDNILALESGGLIIAEDAGKRAHPVDMLWLLN